MRNLHQLFVLCTASQVIGGDFAKFCGLLRIYELYQSLSLQTSLYDALTLDLQICYQLTTIRCVFFQSNYV